MSASGDTPSELGVLLCRHKDGDLNTINAIIECCRTRFERLAHSLLQRPGVPNELETNDLVNDAVGRLIPILRNQVFDSTGDFLRYAGAVMRNTLCDLTKKRRPQSLPEPGSDASGPNPAAEPADTTNDPVKQAQCTEFHNIAAQLPEHERQLFDLFFYLGLKVSEVSELFGIPETTLRTQWQNARINFTRLYGDTPPPI